jgi:hypothetical protein
VESRGTGPVPQLRVEGVREGGRFDAPGGTAVKFANVRFANVDFGGGRFWSFEAPGSTFTACDFRKARLDAGHMGGDDQTVYRQCRFEGARLGKTDAWFARFEQCIFDRAHLDTWKAFNAEFVECHFAGRIEDVAFAGKPDPKHVKWVRPPRSINEFIGNDFRQTELIDVTFFRGIDLNAQLLPDGDQYIRLDRLGERIRKVRADVARWSDDRSRQEALSMLRHYESISREQDELFARRDDMPISKEIRDRIWDMLSAACS